MRVVVFSLSLLLLTWVSSSDRLCADPVKPGADVPAIEAAAWLNGEPPNAEARKGKVLVIDFWAHW